MNLLKQQSEAIAHLHEWKVGALFMEAGTGKTRVAMELVNSVPDIDFILWVGPLQTINKRDGSSVPDEIDKWGGMNKPIRFVGVESISASDRIYLEVRSEIVRHNTFIVVDESLKIKNAEAKRTKRLLELGTLCDYRLILNGTPLTRNLLDLWSQMEFLSPKILAMSLAQFKDTFCAYTRITKYGSGNRSYSKEFITGYENIDYLYSLIRHYIYECDLRLNISQNYSELHYIIDEESRSKYDFLKKKYLDDEMLQWKNNNIFLEMTQKMQHSYALTEDKFDVVYSLFKRINQSETIIYCKYVDSRDLCSERYPEALVLSYQKESMGLNLQAYHHTIYFDKIWDYALRTQSSRRTYRTGQEFNCKYYDLTGNVGLEHVINANIKKKVGIIEYFKKATKSQLKKEL